MILVCRHNVYDRSTSSSKPIETKSLLGMFLNLAAALSICEHVHIWVFEEKCRVTNEVKLGFFQTNLATLNKGI